MHNESSRNSSLTKLETLPEFAPEDPTDGRKLGEWRSIYELEALKGIQGEAIYLAALLILVPVFYCDSLA